MHLLPLENMDNTANNHTVPAPKSRININWSSVSEVKLMFLMWTILVLLIYLLIVCFTMLFQLQRLYSVDDTVISEWWPVGKD
jgi:hypothetical protein